MAIGRLIGAALKTYNLQILITVGGTVIYEVTQFHPPTVIYPLLLFIFDKIVLKLKQKLLIILLIFGIRR